METGRGNIDTEAVERTKDFLRMNHPKPIRVAELALFIGKSQARATRIIDRLSGTAMESVNSRTDFLVYIDDDSKPTTYGIFKDIEAGIYAF